jgi:carboxylesterase
MKKGLFCIHGFLEDSRTSYDYLATILDSRQIDDYYLADVQGHSIEEDINTFDYQKAIADIEQQYIEYKKIHDEVYLIGFSMGGVLAAHLANKYSADKMVLIAPAFKYGNGSQLAKDMFKLLKSIGKGNELPKTREEFKNMLVDYAKQNFPDGGSSYERFVTRFENLKMLTFLNFTKLVKHINKDLKSIDVPTLIFQSDKDELVPLESAFYIFKKISNKHKRIVVLSHVKHRILGSEVKDEVIGDIIRFLY